MKFPAYNDGDTRTRKIFAVRPRRLYNSKVKVWLEFVWVREDFRQDRADGWWTERACWQGKKDDGPRIAF